MRNDHNNNKWLARELCFLACCFVIAEGFNIFTIIKFHTPWTEIFSQIGFVMVITWALYSLTLLTRFLVYGIKAIACRK